MAQRRRVGIMRRMLAGLSLVGLLLAVVAPIGVQAARSTKIVDDAIYISCEVSTADGFVSMTAYISSQYESFGDLAFWPTGSEPYEDAPSVVSDSADVSGDATGLSATFGLVEFDPNVEPPFGDPAGEAILDATFTPDGDPVDVEDRFRSGNRWERVTGTVQPLLADGTLTLPGADVTDLSPCFAAEQHLQIFSTNPSAYTDRFEELIVSCSWEYGDGSVNLFVRADAFETFGDVYISTSTSEIGGGGEALLTEDALEIAFDLQDFLTGDPAGSASASATLESTGTSVRTVDVFGNERVKTWAELFSVDGTLAVTLGTTTTNYPIDDEHCYAADQRVSTHSVRPNGPKPGPLANDTPDGAIALRPGHTTRIVTGGNALEPEAGCVATDPEGNPYEVPIGYTAWWTVGGTGGDLTVDTAGSDFDTVVGVYTMDAGGLEPVGCVDDVFDPDFSLQARITWSSDAGVTYYIQAGGYGDSSGRLELTVQ